MNIENQPNNIVTDLDRQERSAKFFGSECGLTVLTSQPIVYGGRSPQLNLKPEHLQEWSDSAVNPDLVKLNVKSLSESEPYDYLFNELSDSERRNGGILRDKWLK